MEKPGESRKKRRAYPPTHVCTRRRAYTHMSDPRLGFRIHLIRTIDPECTSDRASLSLNLLKNQVISILCSSPVVWSRTWAIYRGVNEECLDELARNSWRTNAWPLTWPCELKNMVYYVILNFYANYWSLLLSKKFKILGRWLIIIFL